MITHGARKALEKAMRRKLTKTDRKDGYIYVHEIPPNGMYICAGLLCHASDHNQSNSIRDADFWTRDKYVRFKVGMTRDPLRRAKELQKHFDQNIVVRGCWPGNPYLDYNGRGISIMERGGPSQKPVIDLRDMGKCSAQLERMLLLAIGSVVQFVLTFLIRSYTHRT